MVNMYVPHNHPSVIFQELSLDANNYKQRPHYLQHQQQQPQQQMHLKCDAAINKSHRIESQSSTAPRIALSWCNCKIIHCKVSKKCNWNANQCKSILESSSAAIATTALSEWMIHSSHASHIQMQIANAKCEMQIAKICNQCDFGRVIQQKQKQPEAGTLSQRLPADLRTIKSK